MLNRETIRPLVLLRALARTALKAPAAPALLKARTALALLCCGALLSGCVKEEVAPLGELQEAAVQFNVGALGAGGFDGTPTDAESRIYSLRVYAFVGGQPAGYYAVGTEAGAEAAPIDMPGGKHTFFMDLRFYSDGVQKVDFYAVANEGAMSLKIAPESSGATIDVALSETTSERVLKNVWFNNGMGPNLEAKGLPMFCTTSVDLDFSKVKTQTPPAGSGHEDHPLLDHEPITFSLQRPVGKIGVFAAKPAGETSTLRIVGLSLLARGVKVRNYLMPQSLTTLQAVLSGGQDLPFTLIDTPFGELAADADKTDPANYTAVCLPFYPFENPWTNGGGWNIPGDLHAHVLKVDYSYDGGETRTGYVYMPDIERNRYYTVCCLIHNDGRIYVEYSVADWTKAPEYEIDFNYPTYTNPLMPAVGDQNLNNYPNKQYPQPTVWYNSSAYADPGAGEAPAADLALVDPALIPDDGCYTFEFIISGPVNLPWKPVMFGATEADFDIDVYQTDATGARTYYDYDNDKCFADPDHSYYIRVRALKSDNVDKTMSLGISYQRGWNPEGGSPLLLINGLTSALAWEGTTVAEFVVIKQVDFPTAQTTDVR